MRLKEVVIHLFFGGFEVFALYAFSFVFREVPHLDAGPILKILVVNQCLLVIAFGGATWIMTTLWARAGVPWLSPPGELVAVQRWRRILRYLAFALFANLALVASLLKTDW